MFTPAELSIASVLRRTPARAASMRPRWVAPRLAPSPDVRPHLAAGDADRVVGAVAHLLVGFGGRADIGADAAEPEKADIRPQDGAHHLGGRRLRLVEAEQRLRLGGSGIDFALRGKTPPPFEIRLLS